MTSQDYSTKKGVVSHGFKITFKQNILTTIFSIVILTLVMAVPVVMYFTKFIGMENQGVRFGEAQVSIMYVLIAALIGIVQAIVTFNFLYNKSAVNTYFSLGIKRSQLFKIHIVSGLLHTFFAVLVPFIVLVIINCSFSGPASLAFAYGSYLFIGLFTTAIITFSITALICSLTYTRAEAITYSVLANLLITFVLSGLNGLMSAFLWGNTYGINQAWNYDFQGNLITHYTRLNPLLFFKPYFNDYVVYQSWEPTKNLFNAELLMPLVLVALLTVIVIVITRKLFIKRYIENTKIMGTCNVLANIVIAPAILASFSAFMYLTRTGNRPMPVITALLLGLLLSTIVYSSIVFPLRVVSKGKLKRLLLYPAYLAVCFAILGLISIGGLGYTNYVPNVENIESMEITYRGLPDMIATMGQSQGVNSYLFENNGVFTLTDEEDINLAISVHQKIISQGWIPITQSSFTNPHKTAIRTMIQVNYTLNNGKKVQRLYPVATLGLLNDMLVLDETNAITKLFSSYMEGDEELIMQILPEPDKPIFQTFESPFINGKIYVKDTLSKVMHLIGENEKIIFEIKQALKTDFANSSYRERYFPTETDKYQLYFVYDHEDEMLSEFVIPEHFFNRRITVIIDSTYINTMAVIKKYYEPEPLQIESLYIVGRYNIPMGLRITDNHSPFYKTGIMDADYAVRNLPEGHVEISDSKEIEALYQLTRGIYHISDGGYLVYLKVKDKPYIVTRYIPRDLLPNEIQEHLEDN